MRDLPRNLKWLYFNSPLGTEFPLGLVNSYSTRAWHVSPAAQATKPGRKRPTRGRWEADETASR